MRVGILLSTLGGSPLQGGIERGLALLGHTVCQYEHGQGYDLLIVFNQVAHNPNYEYPQFPDGHTPIAFVDSAEFGYFTRLPDRMCDYANTFTEKAMAHDTKNRAQQERLRRFLEGKSFPYFLREKHKAIQYPANYHPIDYPLYYLSHCTIKPTWAEYRRRDLELFCSWGASHPWRMHLTEAMRNSHRKSEIHVIGENGHERIPQEAYFRRTFAAKCSVSFDGYGSGSFRMTEVLCRTLLLQGPLSIETRAPLVDGVTCRAYDVRNSGEEFLGTNLPGVLREALEDVDGSYRIYVQGYDHCMTHLTEKATAQYVLDTVAAHDWNVPTSLEV